MSDVSLRPATASDLEFAREVHRRSMRRYVEPLFGWDDAEQAARLEQRFRADGAFVVTLGDQEVGWLLVLEDEASVHLSQIFILPAFQNRGIGTAVLTRLLEYWRETAKPISLGVLKNNPARRLYERLGFRIEREEPRKLFMTWHRRG